MLKYSTLKANSKIYRVGQKTGATLFYGLYNFRNIEQIFTKFGRNRGFFILNIMP